MPVVVTTIDNSVNENANTTIDTSVLNMDEKPIIPDPAPNPNSKKEPKKKKIKDDTEQPIYPCEECTACFTTITDLKVLQ